MTCIVGLVDKGNVYMGGDGLGVHTGTLEITPRSDTKVFLNGPFLIGFTTSFYMGQLLKFKFDPPKQTVGTEDLKYMSTDFIDAVKKLFTDNNFGKVTEGGHFLVGYQGHLYTIDSDYQVGEAHFGYDACGCGRQFAMGALHVVKGTPESRIMKALETAATFSGGVGAPFTVLKLPK